MGSTEQHGPHLPVTTDTDIAVAIVSHPAIGLRLPHAVVAPLSPYGSCGEHDGFPGTLSIGRDATELLLVELGRSASAAFAGVVMVSTHGGNSVAGGTGGVPTARRRPGGARVDASVAR